MTVKELIETLSKSFCLEEEVVIEVKGQEEELLSENEAVTENCEVSGKSL